MNYAYAEATGVGEFQVRIQSGAHSFLMDEPVSVGGDASGPNPFDMMCAALASCTLMTMKLYAKRKGWVLDQLAVCVTHHKDSPGARDRFDRVIELGEVTEEQREGLLKIAQRCPVHLLMDRGADVTVSVARAEPPVGLSDGLHEREMDAACRELGI